MAPRAKRARVEGVVTKELLKKIIKRAAFLRSTRCKTYKEDEAISRICFVLISKDYVCGILVNEFKTYCPHYPEDVLIPFYELSYSFVDGHLELLNDSIRARRRSRFPVPVILYEGKYICRSSACHQNVISLWLTEKGLTEESWQKIETYGMTTNVANYLLESLKYLKVLQNDANLLRHMGVDYICDLRIRNFCGLSNDIINSSEDVYKQVYQGFKKALLPYPTCDFFENFPDNMSIEDLRFDWTKENVGITLQLPLDDDVEFPNINYSNYQAWDVLKLTKNYLLFLLSCITSGKGILVHCVAGEDRTPLFICLLRLSLWADGLIHKTLTPLEMTFLTVAYDWYLFGHNLPNRLENRYQIMRFCFCCLEHISSDRFSSRKPSSEEEESNSSEATSKASSEASSEASSKASSEASSEESTESISYKSERERKLKQVQNLFLEYYDPRAQHKWRTLDIDPPPVPPPADEPPAAPGDGDIDSITFRESINDYLRKRVHGVEDL